MGSIISLISIPFLLTTGPIGHGANIASDSSAAVADSSHMTLVEVQNSGRTPITVSAQNSVGEITLGVVPAAGIKALRVPDWFVGFDPSIDFFVQPKRGLEQESGTLDLRRGERVELVVPAR
jgi:hypothetical protein